MIPWRALVLIVVWQARAQGQCSAGYAWDGASCVVNIPMLDQCKYMFSFCACKIDFYDMMSYNPQPRLAMTASSVYPQWWFSEQYAFDKDPNTLFISAYAGNQFVRCEVFDSIFVAGGYIYGNSEVQGTDKHLEVWVGDDPEFPGNNVMCFKSQLVDNFVVEEFSCGRFGRYMFFGKSDPETTNIRLTINEIVVYSWNGNVMSTLDGNSQCSGPPMPFSYDFLTRAVSTTTTVQVLPTTSTTVQVLPTTSTTFQALPTTTTTVQALPTTTSTVQALPSTTTTVRVLPSTTTTVQALQVMTTTTQVFFHPFSCLFLYL